MAVGDDRVHPLEDDHEVIGLGERDGVPFAVGLDLADGSAGQSREFAGVGGEHDRAAEVGQGVGLPGQGVECVGVEDRGDLDLLDDPVHQVADLPRLTQSGTHGEDIGPLEQPGDRLEGGLEPE